MQAVNYYLVVKNIKEKPKKIAGLDIMEHVGCNNNWVKGSVHTTDCNWNNGCPNIDAGGNGNDLYVSGASDNFNIYSIEWSETEIKFFINNNHYWTFINIGIGSDMWPFDQKFHIILNLTKLIFYFRKILFNYQLYYYL